VEDRLLDEANIPQETDSPVRVNLVRDPGRTVASFARLLAAYREERGLSKADLADLAQMSPSSITRLEQGTRDPERETVLQLARAMLLPLADRDRLLAAAGYRSELWDDPMLIELAQLMADPAVPADARAEARAVVKMAIAYCKMQRLHDS
jgi:transcriptional regulator with XRE-family HTH domain